MTAIRVASLHQGDRSVCPCGTPVEYDEMDGWQHADGSISHDGELSDRSVSDLMAEHQPIYKQSSALPEGYSMQVREDPKTERWGLPAIHVRVHHDGREVGSLSVHQRDFDSGRVGHPNIYVDAEHQRKGLGTAMYAEVHRRWPNVLIEHSKGASDMARGLNQFLHQTFPSQHIGRFTPDKRIFTHTDGLDHRLFEGEHLRPEVRSYILGTITSWWADEYRDWSKWAKIFFAGSEASEWTSPTLEGNGDLDILVGVDYDGCRAANPQLAELTDQQITERMNTGFRTHNGPVTLTVEGTQYGPFDRTTFVNPASHDIRRIKPYSAYDVGADSWVVKPPHLPHWSLSELPKPVQQVLRAADSYARHVLKLPEPERTQQGAALFEAWHTDRSRAFSERGEGWWDIANLREKWGDQQGWWAQLVNCAHRAKQGLDAAPADWSNTPTGYMAVRRDPIDMTRYFAGSVDGLQSTPWRQQGRHIALDPQTWASLPVEDVPTSGNYATQRRVFHKHLDRHQKDDEPEGGDLPWVVEHEGKRWVIDGHHRFVKAQDRGMPTLPTHVMRPFQHEAKLPKTQKCAYCTQQATKRVIWAEGMAYIPVCDRHEQRAKDHVGGDYCNTRPIAKVASNPTMYHWAPQDARDDIAEHGLDHTRAPDFDPAKQGPHGVFLHHNEDLARDWVPDIKRTHDLYAVDTRGLSLRPDPYDTGDASYTECPVPLNRLRRISMMEAPEEGPVPHSPGRLFYRVHPVKRGWSQENASSQPFGGGGPYGEEGEGLPREHGYSAFDNPHDLGRYLNAMDWHRNLPRLPRTEEDREEGRPGRIDPHQIRVVQFPGEIVGHGHDGEHLVHPHARADRQEMDYETFQHRLRQTPHPDVAYHWHKSPYEQVPEWAEGNGHDCDPGGQGSCHNDYSEEAHETGMQPTHHWASVGNPIYTIASKPWPMEIRHEELGKIVPGYRPEIYPEMHGTIFRLDQHYPLRRADPSPMGPQEYHDDLDEPDEDKLEGWRSLQRTLKSAPHRVPPLVIKPNSGTEEDPDEVMDGNHRMNLAHDVGVTHHPAYLPKTGSAQLWITPQLVMGSAAGLNHARQVNSASEAVSAVQQGLTAVLPSGAWFPVRQVLLGLGMSLLDVTQRLKQFGAPSSVTG